MDRDKILEAVTNDWQSTLSISQKLNGNNYIVLTGLLELLIDDKVERMKIKRATYWKLK